LSGNKFIVKYTVFCCVPDIIVNWTFDTVAMATQVGRGVFHSFQHMRFTPRRLRVMFELVFRFFFTPIPGRRRVNKRTLWHIYIYTYKLNWFCQLIILIYCLRTILCRSAAQTSRHQRSRAVCGLRLAQTAV
jgi:hypothetical protein